MNVVVLNDKVIFFGCDLYQFNLTEFFPKGVLVAEPCLSELSTFLLHLIDFQFSISSSM
jgi:hypothetical protein